MEHRTQGIAVVAPRARPGRTYDNIGVLVLAKRNRTDYDHKAGAASSASSSVALALLAASDVWARFKTHLWRSFAHSVNVSRATV